MAKLKDGFYKQTAESVGSDLYVLLAGGGSKLVSDFATASNVVTSIKVGTVSYSPSSGVVSLPAYPTKTSQLTNDSGFLTSLPSHTHTVLTPERYDSGAPLPKDKDGLTFQFSYNLGTGGDGWWNVLNMRSYTDKNYTSAQLITPADNPGKDTGYSGDMKWRQGRNSTWLAWKTILDSSNYTSYVNTTNFPGLNKTGTVTSIKVGSTSYSPSSGVVSLPAYPTLSGLSGVGTVNASGTAPLTLSASKSGTTVTITGSISEGTTSAVGVVKQHKANDCTSYTSDEGATTPAAVKKAI